MTSVIFGCNWQRMKGLYIGIEAVQVLVNITSFNKTFKAHTIIAPLKYIQPNGLK